MVKTDDENVMLAESTEIVDELNSQFYGQFPYPWRPLKLDLLADLDFETMMVNQDIGDWEHRTIPKQAKIWVAGCGTNQAAITALKFPHAQVLGSDLSKQSLQLCSGVAEEIGLSNLELKRESLNQVNYQEQFDYIICTGVIHHNAYPAETLKQLATALKPSGVMELMVYNRFHRIVTSSLQKAVRILSGSTTSDINFESELAIALKLVNGGFATNSMMADFLSEYREGSESKLADTLIQPVEHSYTVESLQELADSCGLEIVAPKINIFDLASDTYLWNTEFSDPELQQHYDSLPDIERWQISNLLHLERSPMLWFYLQRKDSDRTIKSEQTICQEFLQTKFVKHTTWQKSYLLGSNGKYKLSPAAKFPKVCADSIVQKVLDVITPEMTLQEVLQQLGINPDFQTISKLRLKLTTSAFPYLRAS
jgi:SAM-dependent methyltransferase